MPKTRPSPKSKNLKKKFRPHTPRLALDDRLNFMIIGAQKAGTTALDAYLRKHPRVKMAEGAKEVHFFDNDKHFKAEEPVSYRALHRHYSSRTGTCVLGGSTPSYIFLPDAIERIHQYNPNIKLIAVLRNPITRAYSHWNMERDYGKESLPFLEAIRMEQARLQASTTTKEIRSYSYIGRGYYVRQLQNLWRFFPKEQTIVLRQEALKDNPLEVVNTISDFLGIDHIAAVKERLKHSRTYEAPMSLQDFEALRQIYEAEIKDLQDLLGWDCADWLKAPATLS